MKMITELKNRDLIAHNFKVIAKYPEWFKVDKKVTTGKKSYDEMIYLKNKTLSVWHKLMSEADTTVYSSAFQEDDTRWSGAYDWKEYLQILDEGDKDVISKIKLETDKATKNLYKKHERVIARYKFDVVGEQFDVGLVLSGVPEVWLEPEFVENEIPQITLKLNLTYMARVKHTEVIKNAGRILGIAKVLEDTGVQVRIEGFNIFNNYDNEHIHRVLMLETTIKDFNEPINFKKVSAYISPAQFRRGGFYIQDLVTDELDSGRGNPTHLKNTIALGDAKAIDKLESEVFKDEVQ